MDAENSAGTTARSPKMAMNGRQTPPTRAYSKGMTFPIVAIWVVISLAALVALFTATTSATGRLFWMIGGGDSQVPMDYLPQIQQAEPFEGKTAWLIDIPLWIRLLSSAGGLISVAVLITAGIVLHRIIHEIALGNPFTGSVLRDWKTLSLTLILGGIAQGIVNTIVVAILHRAAFSDTPSTLIDLSNLQIFVIDFPRWPWWTLLLGVIAQAISLAFKSGAKLEKDVAGLV